MLGAQSWEIEETRMELVEALGLRSVVNAGLVNQKSSHRFVSSSDQFVKAH